jgi:hypothetical protein
VRVRRYSRQGFTRREALALAGGVATTYALAQAGEAEATELTCFGAPADAIAHFGLVYPYPTVWLEAQAWWAEASGPDPLGSTHIHFGAAFPQGETIQPIGGVYRLDAKLQLRNFVGGSASRAQGFSFMSSSVRSYPLDWKPSSKDEQRFLTMTMDPMKVPCGRRENRMQVRTVSPFADEMLSSTGWQTYVVGSGCPSPTRSSDVIIARGWYSGFDYVNASFPGNWRASLMARPVPVPVWAVKFAVAQGATSYAVYLDPDLHTGSRGQVLVEANGGDGKRTVNVPTGQLASGVHKLMIVTNETHLEAGRAQRGTASGVQVIPFLVGP